jgi:hypothetical protein
MNRSQSQSHFTTGGLPPISSSWRQASWDSRHSNFIFQLKTCDYSPYVVTSLTRGWVCPLQLLLVFASAVIIRSESCGTHDHILLSQIRDSPNLEGQVPVLISRNRVARLYPPALGSLFVAFYYSQGYGGAIRPRLHWWRNVWLHQFLTSASFRVWPIYSRENNPQCPSDRSLYGPQNLVWTIWRTETSLTATRKRTPITLLLSKSLK